MLLVWNLVLTFRLVDIAQNTSDGKTVIHNTIDGYTTDITATVDEAKKYVVSVENDTSVCSGVVVDSKNGSVSILTSYEASEGENIAVVFDSGARASAEVVGSDPETDLSLLRATVEFEVEPITFTDTDMLSSGEYVIGLSGKDRDANSVVSFGVSSEEGFYAFHASTYLCKMLTTDLAISQSQYGGALLNLSGELVGILCKDPQESSNEMSYAISANEAKKVYDQLSEDQEITRGSMNIAMRSIADMKSYEKNQNGLELDRTSGLLVTNVPESSAAYGLIFEGDVITKIDSKPMEDIEDYESLVYKKNSGDEVEVGIERNGESLTVNVVLQ